MGVCAGRVVVVEGDDPGVCGSPEAVGPVPFAAAGVEQSPDAARGSGQHAGHEGYATSCRANQYCSCQIPGSVRSPVSESDAAASDTSCLLLDLAPESASGSLPVDRALDLVRPSADRPEPAASVLGAPVDQPQLGVAGLRDLGVVGCDDHDGTAAGDPQDEREDP